MTVARNTSAIMPQRLGDVSEVKLILYHANLGRDVLRDAWVEMYLFEATCMIQVRAQAGGGELVSIDPRIIAGSMAMRKNASQGVGPGSLTWPALLRKLDRLDPSFRT